MKLHRHTRLIPFIVATLMASPVTFASCPTGVDLAPARFGDGDRAFYNLIEFPENTSMQASVTVQCELVVSDQGEARHLACGTGSKKFDIFRQAIAQAAAKARFQPAMVGSEPKSVITHVSVVFTEDREVVVLPNQGMQRDQFGTTYIEPQRVIDLEDYKVDEDKGMPKELRNYIVSPDGGVVEVDFGSVYELSTPPFRRCFIPGYTREGPMQMTYRELDFTLIPRHTSVASYEE